MSRTEWGKSKTPSFAVVISDDNMARLEREAAATGITVAALLESMLYEFLQPDQVEERRLRWAEIRAILEEHKDDFKGIS